jgi:hypothetical protein
MCPLPKREGAITDGRAITCARYPAVDIGSVIGQLVGGGAGGAILTLIVGVVKNMMAGKAPT